MSMPAVAEAKHPANFLKILILVMNTIHLLSMFPYPEGGQGNRQMEQVSETYFILISSLPSIPHPCLPHTRVPSTPDMPFTGKRFLPCERFVLACSGLPGESVGRCSTRLSTGRDYSHEYTSESFHRAFIILPCHAND